VESKFQRDTAVRRIDDGVFVGGVNTDWWIVTGPNGGTVAAMIMRALEAAVADAERLPRSLTIHFTTAPKEGPIRIGTQVERAGRSLTTVTARVEQEGRLVAVAIAAFSRARRGAVDFAHVQMPDAPPAEELEQVPHSDKFPRFMHNWDFRRAAGEPLWSGASEAVAGGWVRPAETQEWDHALITQLSDVWFPAVFPMLDGPNPIPTVDLTIHFRAELPLDALQPGDFALVRFVSRVSAHGFVEEDGEIWSRDGTLIAQSRQLALLQALSQD
jgi:acyl-CoA thioesterase